MFKYSHKKIVKKIRVSFVLWGILATFFFINGIKKLYIGWNGIYFESLIHSDWSVFKGWSYLEVADLLDGEFYWSLYAFTFFIFSLFILVHFLKISIVNPIIIFLVIMILFFTGVFGDSIFTDFINYFCRLLSTNFRKSFIFGGIILTILSLLILLIPIMKFRPHSRLPLNSVTP